jgi:hypothetical protein
MPIHLSEYMSVYMSMHMSTYMSIPMSIHMSVRMSMHMSTHSTACVYTCGTARVCAHVHVFTNCRTCAPSVGGLARHVHKISANIVQGG